MLKVKNIKPTANHIVTTMEMYSIEELQGVSKLIDATKMNTVKEYQKVIAVGPFVKDIKVGDIVRINPSRYIQILHKQGSLKGIDKKTVSDEMHSAVDIPRELIYTKDAAGNETSEMVMILFDNDVMCIVEGEEFNPMLTISENKIITP